MKKYIKKLLTIIFLFLSFPSYASNESIFIQELGEKPVSQLDFAFLHICRDLDWKIAHSTFFPDNPYVRRATVRSFCGISEGKIRIVVRLEVSTKTNKPKKMMAEHIHQRLPDSVARVVLRYFGNSGQKNMKNTRGEDILSLVTWERLSTRHSKLVRPNQRTLADIRNNVIPSMSLTVKVDIFDYEKNYQLGRAFWVTYPIDAEYPSNGCCEVASQYRKVTKF